MADVTIVRLTTTDAALARQTFRLMAEVFGEGSTPLGDGYLDNLLGRTDFWALAAVRDGAIAGGLTAHALPLTRFEARELFIFDIAVHPDHQRQGIGRRLMAALREAAAADGITEVFVPADNDDTHALDFYRALGGDPAPVTIFTFSTRA